MTKRIDKSNLIKMPKAKTSDAEKLAMAQRKVYDAWESTGKRRVSLAREALGISEDCADAYIVLAEETKNGKQRISLYRKAVAAGNKTLGADWESKYQGVCWLANETRPVMRAIARLAMELQSEDELQEALTLYRKLMKLNPNDNQGIRYQFAGCLYEAKCGAELEELLASYDGDSSAALLYTKALHYFYKSGSSRVASKALKEAFTENIYVPLFLSDVVEMPDEPPSSIGFGDDREAIAYVMDQGYLWWDTEGATTWMAKTLSTNLRKLVDEIELVEDALNALQGKYED